MSSESKSQSSECVLYKRCSAVVYDTKISSIFPVSLFFCERRGGPGIYTDEIYVG